MSYNRAAPRKKAEEYSTPSSFGSHLSMKEEGADAPDGQIVLRDELGLYTTLINRLDDGLADPKRYSNRTPEKK